MLLHLALAILIVNKVSKVPKATTTLCLVSAIQSQTFAKFPQEGLFEKHSQSTPSGVLLFSSGWTPGAWLQPVLLRLLSPGEWGHPQCVRAAIGVRPLLAVALTNKN